MVADIHVQAGIVVESATADLLSAVTADLCDQRGQIPDIELLIPVCAASISDPSHKIPLAVGADGGSIALSLQIRRGPVGIHVELGIDDAQGLVRAINCTALAENEFIICRDVRGLDPRQHRPGGQVV